MSFARRHGDAKKGKVNNLVAKHNDHKGGVHGKSKKAQRTNFKANLNQYDLDDLLNDELEDDLEEDYQ